MFLAIKEIQYSKLKYFLTIGLVFLIGYLVFFLTGLAYGLAESNRSAIDSWQADTIVLADGVDNRIQMSRIDETLIEDVQADEKTKLALQMVLLESDNAEEMLSGQLIGIDADEFLMPELVDGRVFENLNEVIVDQTFLEQNDLALGDSVMLPDVSEPLEIVGVTEGAQLSVQPVLYIDLRDFQDIFSPAQASVEIVSAIVTRGNTELQNDDLEKSAINDFINDLPGYRAQFLTFTLMIGFLIVIATVVIGIFIYVLTLQKVGIFGILKAQGISNRYLIFSILNQTLILSSIGVIAGLFVTYISALFLPVEVPFTFNWSLILPIALIMIVFASLGGVFSSRMITKIDPLEAI